CFDIFTAPFLSAGALGELAQSVREQPETPQSGASGSSEDPERRGSSRLAPGEEPANEVARRATAGVTRGREAAGPETLQGACGLPFVEDHFFAVSSGNAQKINGGAPSSTPSQRIGCSL